MSSSTKWREEQVLVICPGSSTTMAQLGCNELTPPSQRFPTRMFKDEETGQWRPYYTYKRKKKTTTTETTAGADADATGASNGEAKKGEHEDEYETIEDPDSDEGAVYPIQGGRIVHMDAFLAFLDHVHSMLTTTYHNTPIVLMASPQWTRPHCEAIARYIFEKTRTPALCLIHSGVATQYGLRWPNMTVVDIGYEKVDVTCIHENRVVSHRDVRDAANEGAISGGEVFTQRLWELLRDKEGGFSHEMAEQLKKSQICEVLPYAADQPDLVELPTASVAQPPAAAGSGGPTTAPTNAGASATAPASAPAPPPAAAASGTTIGDAPATLDAEDGEDKTADNDGVLDIANIVTSGQTKEFLAKKEKEKAEKAKAGKKGKGPEAADANKPTRLPNSKRTKNTFHYEEIIQVEPSAPAPAPAPAPKANGAPAQEAQEEKIITDETVQSAAQPADQPVVGEEPKPDAEAAREEKPQEEKSQEKPQEEKPEEEKPQEEKPQEEKPQEEKPQEEKTQEEKTQEEKTQEGEQQQLPPPAPAPEPQPSNNALKIDNFLPPPETTAAPIVPAEPQARRVRRDIEVGLERFTFADRKEIDRIATAIYDAVQNIGDMYMRPACWDNLVFVGNGSRIRGLKDNIVQTLTSRYLISPSSATMFTSELPSNMATPSGTGSQTPTGNFSGPPHTMPMGAGPSSGVNPLLQAATTASLQQAQQQGQPQHPGVMTPGGLAGSQSGEPMLSHHFHSQTPTSIKMAPMPTYLAEWTKHGFEEAMFLGSLVAARLAFCVHNMDAHGLEAQRLMSLNRVDYNELGPKGVRTHSMFG